MSRCKFAYIFTAKKTDKHVKKSTGHVTGNIKNIQETSMMS